MTRKMWAWIASWMLTARWRKQRTPNAVNTVNPERVAMAVADEVHVRGSWEVWVVEHNLPLEAWSVKSYRAELTEVEAKRLTKELQADEDEIIAKNEGGYVRKHYAAIRRARIDEVWLA